MAKEFEAVTKWPQVTLSQIDSIYQTKGLAEYFATLLFTAIYAQGNGGVSCNQEVAKMQAGLFLAEYGRQCSMFDYMLYMGTYRSKYKPDYISNGDLSDIIKRFPEYMKHKKGNIMEAQKQQPKTETRTSNNKSVGKEALEIYLKRAAERGDNLLESGLVAFGMVTREHAKEVMDKYGPKAF